MTGVCVLAAFAGIVGSVWVGEADAHATATLEVCSTGPYLTIQSAVAAAHDGDTIEVCAGTYTEQITIPVGLSGLTLSAASKKVVIKAPASMSGEKAIVEVAGAKDITIKGFTIRGPGGGDCGSIGYGVEVDGGGSATVDSNDILDIRDEPLSGCQNGVPIGAVSGSVTATSNLIKDFQKTGIRLTGVGSVNTIKDNTIVGAGSTAVIAQNGITVSSGASAAVSENTISDAFYSPNTVTATGIYVAYDPGDVTVENNTLHDNQTNIYVYGIGPSAKITVSGNTISGGNDGIDVVTAVGVRIADNTTDGQANFGLQATDDASGNTFDGNKASGVTGEGNYDCFDGSLGDKTAATANTWTGNTGTTISPVGICSPAGAPSPTPTPTPTPPSSGGEAGSGAGESSGPIDDLEVPKVIVVSNVPVAPTSPADAVNPVTVTTPNGTKKATGNEKAVQTTQTVVATMHKKKLSACGLSLTTTDGHKTLVARGFATAPESGTGRMVITVRAVPAGKLLLEAHFGGVLALAHAKCLTTADGKPTGTVTAFKTALVVLQVEQTVTAPATFLPDQAVLTPTGKQFLSALRTRITTPLLLRCDGYTATYPPSPVNAQTLSKERAEVACRMLNQNHLVRPPHIAPHGNSDPIATNSTELGRSHNRRVEITLVHRVQPQV